MFKVVQLVFSPAATWEKIAAEARGVVETLLLSLLPIMLLATALEAWSLIRFGERRDLGHVVRITEQVAFRYGLTQLAAGFAVIFIGTKFLASVASSFHLQATYQQCFTTVAYGFCPLFLGQAIDAIPALPTWISWAIGAVLSVAVLYHGVALVLKPDQTKGFGLYILTSIFGLMLSAFAHFVSVSVLHDKILILSPVFRAIGL